MAGDNPTLTGNEITDSVRRANVQGDGLAPEQQATGFYPATTNLVTNGGFESNTTGWNNVSIASLTRITSQYKFGGGSGQVVTSNLVTAEGCYHNFTATVAAYSITAWVRGSAGGTVRIGVRDNVGANPQISNPVTLSTTWQRIWIVTTNLTAATWRMYVETDVQQSLTFEVDGVQAERLSIPTPYIETNGATATRGYGLATATTNTFLSPATSWVAFRIQPTWGVAGSPIPPSEYLDVFRWVATSDVNDILVFYRAGATNQWYMQRYGQGNLGQANVAQTFNPYVTKTVIGAWTSAPSVKLSVDGAAFVTTATAANTPTMGTALPQVGHGAWYGNVYWVAAGTGTLTDANAALINSFNNDPKIADFPGTPTWFWDSGPDGPQQVLPMGMLGTGRV